MFRVSECPAHLRVRFVVHMLRGAAKDWWGLLEAELTEDEVNGMTWEEFLVRFRARFVPQVEVDRITREFLALEQRTETVTEITKRFMEMVQFVPQYAASESLKKNRYHDMLRTDIREFVNNAQFTTLAGVIEAARSRELELETQAKKRKAAEANGSTQAFAKKAKFGGAQGGQRQGGPKGNGEANIVCHRCGRTGHKSKDCNRPILVCYGCGKQGHTRPNCPAGTNGGQATRPLATANPPLRITDGRTGTAPPPKATGRVFQLTAEKAQSTPDVVTGTI